MQITEKIGGGVKEEEGTMPVLSQKDKRNTQITHGRGLGKRVEL